MTMPEAIRTLYPKVTSAIMRAENAEARGDASAKEAYSDVSRIEEEISTHLPAASPQGAVSRRGAVRAAIYAGDLQRAQSLAERYAGEADIEAAFAEELRGILKDGGVTEERMNALVPVPRLRLAERLYPMAVGDDELLHLRPALPPDAASKSDAKRLYGEILRVLAEFAVYVALREDHASTGYAHLANSALAAAAPELDSCSPLEINRALRKLDQVYRAQRQETTLAADEVSLLAKIHQLFESLPSIFPALADYRKRSSYDSFITPPVEVKQNIIDALARAAKARNVVSPELAIAFSRSEIAIATAPKIDDLGPERELRWTTAEAYLQADFQLQSAESASKAEADRGVDWVEFREKLAPTQRQREWREETLQAAE